MKDLHTDLALRYFNYLAKRFPVMCASDEFHFLPRAEVASEYYDQLDDLRAGVIDECIGTLNEFQKEFSIFEDRENDLEKFIDVKLLQANVAGILIELEKDQSWRHNPLLYLKIAFIGLDHALTKPVTEPGERMERVFARLYAIPRLLNQAIDNIDSVPETYHKAAHAMLRDCKRYLAETIMGFPDVSSGNLTRGVQKTLSALDAFGKFLCSISPVPDRRFTARSLEARLNDNFLSARSLAEVYQMAVDDLRGNLEQLEKLQSKIDPNKSWEELYHAFRPSDVEKMDTISLYQREIEQLRRFFSKHDFRDNDLNSSLELTETPAYLQSVRSAASFCAAFSADAREKSFFYITPHLPRQRSKEEAPLKKRLHREFKFLAAHETIPGHHLLDSIRRRLENPVRRQIESPFFYEGWAYYAESLLTEYGYVDSPMERLVDYKRRLWRSARCQIDVGLPMGALDREDAIRVLTATGFTQEEAKRQIYCFQLNPGYQLCYSLGRYEIVKLKEAYGTRMGRERFHTHLLEGGELPFHLIGKRLEALYPSDATNRQRSGNKD